MFPEVESALVLTIRTSLTEGGHNALENLDALALSDQLLAFASATVTIAGSAIRVEACDATGDRLIGYELGEASGPWRRGRLINYREGIAHTLRLPSRKSAPHSWVMPQENAEELVIFLENRLQLRAQASRPNTFTISPLEACTFWGDLFWLQPEVEVEQFWDRLARFGLPQMVLLEDTETGNAFVEITITSAKRVSPGISAIEGYRVTEALPLRGSTRSAVPTPTSASYALGAGSGEHIGWIIAPSIVDETQKLVNKIAHECGEFDKYDAQGSLIIDWYDRATQKLGTKNLNAFTRVRELLKSVIALHILPGTVNAGEIPPEIDLVYGQGLKDIFANKKVAADKRWCTFLNGFKKPPPEFGGPQPTAADDKQYRESILLEMVDDVLQTRYAKPVIERPKPYSYSCWAFNFDARGFKMKLLPGANVLKTLAVTSQGLRLDVVIERVIVDFEYETEPSGSAGNVALCIASLGLANVVEIQFGNASVEANDVLLSLDLIPTQIGKQIKLTAKMGSKSHVDLSYNFQGSNIFTLGLTEVLGAIFSLADAFEGDLLDTVADAVEGLVDDLDIGFPDLFNFEDAPDPVMDTAIVVANPGKAQLIGARLTLPAERAPSPLPTLTMPTCSGDFAVTLATDYLNGVVAYRLARFKNTAKALSFDWKQYLNGTELPDVNLPTGYKPPEEGGKYPSDYEDNYEEWTIGAPVFKPATLAARPGLNDAIGVIHIPITYRLLRTHWAWGGTVRGPLVAPEWWWMGLKGPIGPGHVSKVDLVIDLDNIVTAKYGMYRQADDQVISPAPPGLVEPIPLRINPSPAWHAVDMGGIVVEWYSYAVATEEHINVQLEATVPAHLNLLQSPAFLPTLDLTYGTLQVAVKKAAYSNSFPTLPGQPGLFSQLVESYLKPFANLHPFTKVFQHPYLNIWPICDDFYMAFTPQETPITFIFTIDSMFDPADSQKLNIEKDGARLKITFKFLEQLAD